MSTVLLVDDDVFLREILRKTFIREGWTVYEASNGEEGYERAREEHPAIIVLDIRMPKRNGFETLQLLKRDPDVSEIPVVMLSSLSSKEDVQFCFQQGAAAYLVKGHYSPEEIFTQVAFALEKQRVS